MDKNSVINIGPPDMGKWGIVDDPVQQQSKFGIGGNDIITTNSDDDWFWDWVGKILPCTGNGGCSSGGAGLMEDEEDIIL